MLKTFAAEILRFQMRRLQRGREEEPREAAYKPSVKQLSVTIGDLPQAGCKLCEARLNKVL